MTVAKTAIHGVLELGPQVFGDDRGWFMESYSQRKLHGFGVHTAFVQDNQSYTAKERTLRGLHCQLEPHAQAKLVRVLRGAMLDVVVDVREGSPSFMRWMSVELSAENKKQLFIPKGCLHGFVTLTDDVEVFYKCDEFYSPEHERCVRWNDPGLGICWNVKSPLLSQKDASAPDYSSSDVRFVFEGV